jgi:hypothetical protein
MKKRKEKNKYQSIPNIRIVGIDYQIQYIREKKSLGEKESIPIYK